MGGSQGRGALGVRLEAVSGVHRERGWVRTDPV